MDRGSSSTSPWKYMDFGLQTRKGDSRKYSAAVRLLMGEAQVLLRDSVKREKRCMEEDIKAVQVQQ
jgi:hypothetical protein